jgi:hypothetical protein
MSMRGQLLSWGVPALLGRHPGLRVIPDDHSALLLRGRVTFVAAGVGLETLTDTYSISIRVPRRFPQAFPQVRDEGHRIDPKYHRLDDGSFCLGSPVRLRLQFARSPDLLTFFNELVIPFLYGYSYHEKYGRPAFGELDHGDQGLVDDFKSLFGLSSAVGCATMLGLIGMKKRVANKRPCPCGRGRRLGRCHWEQVQDFRRRLGRRWCRTQAQWISEEYVNASPEAPAPQTAPSQRPIIEQQRKSAEHQPSKRNSAASELHDRLKAPDPGHQPVQS